MKKTSLIVVAGLAVLLTGCGNHNTATSNHHSDTTPKTETVQQSKSQIQQRSSSQVINDSSFDNNSQSIAQHSDSQIKSVKAQQFENRNQAASYVAAQPGYTTQNQQGLPKVDLGDGITGTLNSGAGQQMLQWNEGNWTFTVRASAVQGQDPTSTAKQVVAELEKVYLPAPQGHGVGTFDIASGSYTLTWQKNNKVYQVTGTSPSDVISKAVSAGNK